MTDPSHSVRKSLAAKAQSSRLQSNLLVWRDSSDGQGGMAFANVRQMRLSAYATPIGESDQCTLRETSRDKIKVRSALLREPQ